MDNIALSVCCKPCPPFTSWVFGGGECWKCLMAQLKFSKLYSVQYCQPFPVLCPDCGQDR